jgi:hypothetical protein
MFAVSTSVQVGDGRQARFWQDRWIDRVAVHQLGLEVFSAVAKRVRCSRTVRDAFHQNQWIRNITRSLSTTALSQYVMLWARLQGFALSDNPDKFIWKR